MEWTPERIKDLRARLDLNQTEMADAMGYSTQARVSDLERGKRKPSGTTSRLLDYMDAFGLLPSWASPDRLGEHVLLTTEETGMRAIYEPARDRCWIEYPDAAEGGSLVSSPILLSALADNAAISIYDGLFLPDWWMLREYPAISDVIELVKSRGRACP